MKKLFVLLAIVMLTAPSAGCGRWNRRGAACNTCPTGAEYTEGCMTTSPTVEDSAPAPTYPRPG